MRKIDVSLDTQLRVNKREQVLVYYEGELLVITNIGANKRVYCNILPNADVTDACECSLSTNVTDISKRYRQVGTGKMNDTNITKGISMLKAYYKQQRKLNMVKGA